MINYIIQVLLFQTVFLAVYDLVLKKETFFQWNRAYLIITSVLAYVIPLIKFTGVTESIPSEYRIMLPEVMLSPETYIETQVENATVLFDGMQWVFIIGVLIASIIFVTKLYQIFNLIRQNSKEKNKDYNLVHLPTQHTSFSFFHYIFLGKTTHKKEEIIEHELIHVKQKHSIDLLFFELQKIVLWFNPYSYIYQNRIAEIHEFIADAKTVNKKEKSTFYNSLLAETFRVDKMAFVNSYNKQSIIKKRIIMFSKEKSKEFLKFKYVLLIPVLMSMLFYTSCENTEAEKEVLKSNEKRLVKSVMGGYTKKDGTVVPRKVVQGSKEGYLDLYIFGAKSDGKEISYEELTIEEKKEFDMYNEKMKEIWDGYATYKFYEKENGNRLFQEIIDTENYIKSMRSKDYSNAGVVPFSAIDRAPVFPGCEDAEDQKACLIQKISEHVSTNFDIKIGKDLGLDKGTKRVYVQFKIDKTGKIVDLIARGPHENLEEEATRVMRLLPQMFPGEENGRKVGVKYTLPITFVVD